MLGKIAAVFLKDLTLEWRRREALVTICLFSILIVFIFRLNFGLDPTREETFRLLPGLLWVAFAFSGGCGDAIGRSPRRKRTAAWMP